MLDPSYVDAVIVAVSPDPFDPDDVLLKVRRYDQSIVIAFDVQDDAIGTDDARAPVVTLDLGSASPTGPLYLVEPRLERRLQRWLIAMPGTPFNELS